MQLSKKQLKVLQKCCDERNHKDVQDTTWCRSTGCPARYSFSTPAGNYSPTLEEWNLLHRYTWGGAQYGCVEKCSCCHLMPPAIDRLAKHLSNIFEEEFGGLHLSAG